MFIIVPNPIILGNRLVRCLGISSMIAYIPNKQGELMSDQTKTPLLVPQEALGIPSTKTPLDSIIQQRIQTWKEKSLTDHTGVELKATKRPESENSFNTEQDLSSEIDTKIHSKRDVIASLYSKVSGSGNEAYTNQFIREATAAMINYANENDATAALNAFQGGMLSMDPQDPIEAQLCAKLMALHSKAMFFMNRATVATHQKNMDQNLNN